MNPITSENNKLGFIGIGYMGRPIVQRLLASGFKVAAYDRDRNKAQELVPIWRHSLRKRCATFLQL
jgi:6-phosphogluconate dehydrogenase (decarboxylating)